MESNKINQQQKICYVSFVADINPITTEVLLHNVFTLMGQGYNHLYFLFSTVGGNVDNGITLYNILRGLPIEITMHNSGSVNSIGNVIFLAGKK